MQLSNVIDVKTDDIRYMMFLVNQLTLLEQINDLIRLIAHQRINLENVRNQVNRSSKADIVEMLIVAENNTALMNVYANMISKTMGFERIKNEGVE